MLTSSVGAGVCVGVGVGVGVSRYQLSRWSGVVSSEMTVDGTDV
jgi:hypothetical protein